MHYYINARIHAPSLKAAVPALVAAILLGLSAASAVAQTYTITTLARLRGTNGAQPKEGVIDVGGTLYGTTMDGGANGLGTVFSIPASGGSITTLAAFDGSHGASPTAGLIAVGNVLYGT